MDPALAHLYITHMRVCEPGADAAVADVSVLPGQEEQRFLRAGNEVKEGVPAAGAAELGVCPSARRMWFSVRRLVPHDCLNSRRCWGPSSTGTTARESWRSGVIPPT